jgi:Glycosyltransferase WbsX
MAPLECVAYYLGQFHPTPDNDSFWGEGFTEWHSVARARPLYPGHEQPKLPGRLGFYDLRLSETLAAQIDYAQEVGVTAFCFWHYWFAGRRLLHRPLDGMLGLNHPHFRFMLGWANESWSGVWHGNPHRVLVEQTYGFEEMREHAILLARYIDSGRYINVDGRFPLVIYKPRQIPDARTYLGRLREEMERINGAQLYLIGNWSPGRKAEFSNPEEYGLDAAVISPVGAYFPSRMMSNAYRLMWMSLRRVGAGPEIFPYRGVSATLQRAVQSVQGTAHATVLTGWDNTPRSGRRGLVLSGYNERSFRRAAAAALALERRNASPLLFIKSWNEWAEGNVLEPLFNERWSAGSELRAVLDS